MFIDAQGRTWFKGNLHMHTKESDGRKYPQDAYEVYAQQGYDFVARTDHWKLAPEERYKDLLVLSGCEFNIDPDPAVGVYHIVGFGYEGDPGISRDMPAQEIIDRIHAAGGLAVLAHPAWSLNTPEMMAGLQGIDMCEIYNSLSGYPRNCRPYSGLLLDMLAVRGLYWKISAADDTHFYTPADTARSFVYVQAEACTREALLEAFKAGRFYASQGPTLEVSLTPEGAVEVSCSEVESLTYCTDRPWDKNRTTVGRDLTADVFTPAAKTRFVRVEATDTLGRTAWSQYLVL